MKEEGQDENEDEAQEEEKKEQKGEEEEEEEEEEAETYVDVRRRTCTYVDGDTLRGKRTSENRTYAKHSLRWGRGWWREMGWGAPPFLLFLLLLLLLSLSLS